MKKIYLVLSLFLILLLSGCTLFNKTKEPTIENNLPTKNQPVLNTATSADSTSVNQNLNNRIELNADIPTPKTYTVEELEAMKKKFLETEIKPKN